VPQTRRQQSTQTLMMTPQPVILFCFNRPAEVAQVCEALAEAEPRRIYICADGPRGPEDVPGCVATLGVIRDTLRGRDVKFLVRESNLGCRASVLDGLDWFFAQEEMGIVLEDDCVPSLKFFEFADELLPRYKDDAQVAMISGDNFGWPHNSEYSYDFSRYTFIWGWATWKDKWDCRVSAMQGWQERRAANWLTLDLEMNSPTARYWTDIFDKTSQGQVNAWSYEWLYSCWVQDLLTVVPAVNLVTNIGFGLSATNTRTRSHLLAGLPTAPLDATLRHPPTTVRDPSIDRWAESHVYRTQRTLNSIALREGVRLKHFLLSQSSKSLRQRS
jgi:hypothetical protein